ncbi:MAG TPA: CocE/NonD family hydrolase [Mucilaginibacter sp.]
MNKRFFIILICFIAANTCIAQQFYWSTANTDSVAIDRQIPLLANEVLSNYKNPGDQRTYLDNKFKLEILAHKYADAKETVFALRAISRDRDPGFADLLYIQHELFAQAKLDQEAANGDFKTAFTNQFRKFFKGLSDKEAIHISTAFITRNGIDELKNNFQNSITAIKQDGIDINIALSVCKNYYWFRVYETMEPIARQLLREDDQQRYVIQDSVLIKTRDGAYISAIVVHKKGVITPQPTILQFTIYTGAISAITKDDVARGYIGMIAFTRGKRFSPNEVVPYQFDGNDCYDVIDWISKQPWSNGKVGMYGGSYGGFTQWAAAKHMHPALKTIVPSASAAPGLDVPMMNNVFESFVFPWIYYVSNNKFLDYVAYNNTAKWDSVNAKWYVTGKPYHSLDSLTGRGTNKIFQSWISHPAYDKYWQDMIPYKQDFSNINIPILTTTGYYDGGQVGALYYFREHYKYNKNANHYLIIGPYNHYGSQGFVSIPDPEPVISGYQIDPVANIHIHEIIFQWFDYILKNGKKPEILKDKINYQPMDSNEWKHVPSLDKMSNDTLKFYLSNVRSGDHYILSSQKQVKSGFLTETVDFADRKTSNTFYHVDTIVYNKLDTSNGLSFISEPLNKPMSINGCFFGETKAAINKKDMDYNINLYELMPNGKYFYLSYFMGRASYASDHGTRRLLKPGVIETIPFTNTYLTSKKLEKGSRIVIVISVNKSRDNQINYGTGKEVSSETIADAKTPLQVKWYNSSVIKIPVGN